MKKQQIMGRKTGNAFRVVFWILAASFLIFPSTLTHAATPVKDVYIYYNANGGKAGGGDTDIKKAKTTATYGGKDVNLYNFGSFGLSREGYSRKDGKEWNTKADGTGLAFDQDVDYAPTKFGCQKVAAGAASTSKKITLYAQWTPNSYTVKFNGNGGTPSSDSKTVTYKEAYGSLPSAARSGYTFAGWYTAKSGGTKVTAKSKLGTAGTTTLYAHWTANKYTVKFDANGGSSSSASKSVTYASTYGTLPTATKSGYTLAGWYTAKTDGSKITDKSTVSITKDTTLYAHWTASKYTITYNACGGKCSATTKSVTYMQEVGNLATPSRTGYTFVAWYSSPSGGSKYVETTKMSTAGNLILYAHWKANGYTVEYYDNSTLIGQSSHAYDASKALNANTITKAGYRFIGWASSVDGVVKFADRASVKNLSAENEGIVKLYAVWIPDSEQTSFGSTLENDENNFRFKNNSTINLNSQQGISIRQEGVTSVDGDIEYDGYIGKGFNFRTTGDNAFYEIKLINLSYSDTVYLDMYDSDGSRIDDLELEQKVASTGRLIVKLDRTVQYSLVVYADNGDSNLSGIVSVSVTEVPDDAGDTIAEAAPIELNMEQSACFNGTDDIDCFSFMTTTQNAFYSINFSNISVPDGLSVDLYNQKNVLEKQLTVEGSSNEECLLRLEKNQKYTLVVSGEYDSADAQYLFSVNLVQDDTGNTIKDAKPVSVGTINCGKIDGPDDIDVFSFTTTKENAYYLLNFYNDTALTINVQLKNHKNEVISEYETKNVSGDIADEILEVEKDHQYYIEVSVDGNENETGEYHFSVMKIVNDHGSDAASATKITAGKKVKGEFELDENVDMFSFNTGSYNAYDIVVINESSSGGFDYDILNSNQTVLASDTVSSNQTSKLEGEDCVDVSRQQTCYIRVTGMKDTKYTIYFKPTAFTATYHMNGGTNNASNPKSYYKGKSYTLADPVRNGYKFLGWYEDSDFYTRIKKVDGLDNAELYASWRKLSASELKTYTVTYKLNGGTNHKSNVKTFKAGQKVKYKNPSRKGYIFAGWYSDKKLTKKVTKTTGKGNCTVYAKWKKVSVPKVTVTSCKSASSQKIKIVYRKVSVKGYQIQYSIKSDYKNAKSVITSKTSYTLGKLSKGKKYYIRVRAYKTDSCGKRVYGRWTKVQKPVTAKK